MSGALAVLAGALHDSRAPLEADNDGARATKAAIQKKIEDIKEVRSRDNDLIDVSAIPALFDALKNKQEGQGLDDRLLLLEKMLVIMSHLPAGDPLSSKLQDAAIELFYKDLPHPPAYMVAPNRKLYEQTLLDKNGKPKDDYKDYPYRAADGSNNNPLQPMLGMAGQPYARTVPSTRLIPPSSLPDPGLVFDTLLRRPDNTFKPHPAGISALFFAFADLVIHSIFNTDHTDYTINKSSSYLDLSPLYGNNEAEVDKVRRKDGTGRLWDDVFSDSRLLFMPPAVCALLVLLSRNHNYIATKLRAINERGIYRDPSTLDEKAREKQDDRLFHQARLVNTGYFMQIILGDYVGAILGLARDRIGWRLDPLVHMRSSKDHTVSPIRGEGSLVSVEFNLMYRWHSTISKEDTKWTQDLFNKLFNNKHIDEVTIGDFVRGAHELVRGVGPDPRKWTFDSLKRDASGKFNDGDLARLIQDSTGSYAAAFQARGSPACMRVIEILGIEEARAWGCCSMNEFRRFMGLKPYASFKEWNSDPAVHKAAAALYKDIENLELYVGLQAEQPKDPGPGAGLCPGYTISRAILSDAVCLTRGDRFLTTDFTPFHLTNWGYQDCILSTADKEDGSYGGILTKLLFRTLPDYYPAGSAYAHFPFLVPEFLKQEWLKRGHVDLVSNYSWDRPHTPVHPTITVNEEKKEWKGPYETRINKLAKGTALDTTSTKKALEAKERKWDEKFTELTKRLIANKSFIRAGRKGNFVDIVRDVINIVPVHWISTSIAGLPLKSDANPRGTLQEQEVYDSLAAVSEYLLLNFEPTHDWILRDRSERFYKQFTSFISTQIGGGSLIGGFLNSAVSFIAQTKDVDTKQFLAEVSQGKFGDSANSLAASIFAQVVPSAAQYSHVLSLVVDHYADNEEKKKEFVRLAALNTKEGNEAVVKLVREALAVNPPVSSVIRTCMADSIVGEAKVHAGQRVFINLPTPSDAAAKDGLLFPGLSGDGLLSPALFAQTAPKVLAAIFSLKGLKKASKFAKFAETWRDGKDVRYIDENAKTSPFPTSLVVQYDL